jgi:hypothetical protein
MIILTGWSGAEQAGAEFLPVCRVGWLQTPNLKFLVTTRTGEGEEDTTMHVCSMALMLPFISLGALFSASPVWQTQEGQNNHIILVMFRIRKHR